MICLLNGHFAAHDRKTLAGGRRRLRGRGYYGGTRWRLGASSSVSNRTLKCNRKGCDSVGVICNVIFEIKMAPLSGECENGKMADDKMALTLATVPYAIGQVSLSSDVSQWSALGSA